MTVMEPRTINLSMDLCLRVGELLLSSGAGVADVQANMQELARALGLRHPDIDVTFTALSMSVQTDPEESPLMQVRHVQQRTIDYEHLTLVDHLVRDVLRGDVELKEARTRLGRIVSSGHSIPRWAVALGSGAMCAGVALMFGGGPLVMAVAFVSAVVIDRIQLALGRRRVPAFYQQIAGGAVASLIAIGVAGLVEDVDISLVVSANIVMLLAGIGFMGALQDALSGFYITASARLTETLMATAGIIGGVSGGLSAAHLLGIDVGRIDPGSTDLKDLTGVAVGGAIAGAAFAFSSYAPRRTLAPVAVLAAIAVVISQSIDLTDLARPWASAVAATFVGTVSFALSARLRVPPLVVIVPAVVPMLPGLSVYRGLTLLVEGGGNTSAGLLALMTAASVALALASGVILGEYVAQPLNRTAGRLETRLSGPRLIGPLIDRTRKR